MVYSSSLFPTTDCDEQTKKKLKQICKPYSEIISLNVCMIFFEIDVNTHIYTIALSLWGGSDVYTWYVCRMVVEWKH